MILRFPSLIEFEFFLTNENGGGSGNLYFTRLDTNQYAWAHVFNLDLYFNFNLSN